MTAPRVGIILQARLASTRLPAKALERLGARTVLGQCLHRLTASGVGPVILATTDAAEDDALALVATQMGAVVFRGNRDDVLDRFVAAAEACQLDTVIRASADNPAMDIDSPARLLTALHDAHADYVWESGLPYGGGVEAVTVAALRRAHATIHAPYDREHVTTGIRARPDIFRVVETFAPPVVSWPSLRVTVDTREDLAWMRELYARAGADTPSLSQLIAAARLTGKEAA